MEIPVTPPTTAYMRVGELFSYLCLGVTMAAIGTAAVRRRGK
jgi:sulfite exporter TauE/SafE